MVRPSAPDPPEIGHQLWADFHGDYGWDVGANCGQTYMVMQPLFNRVTLFEPCQESYDEIREYFWAGIDARRLALSDHDGEVQLAFPAEEQRQTGQLVTPGLHGMEWEPDDWSEADIVAVPCRTADSLAAELGVPDFMKVDTEGHEHLVLRGAVNLIAAGRTDFLVEFHSPENHSECEGILESAGYKVSTVRHPHYPVGGDMYRQHGWLRAFAPR